MKTHKSRSPKPTTKQHPVIQPHPLVKKEIRRILAENPNRIPIVNPDGSVLLKNRK